MFPVNVGALGCVTKIIEKSLEKLGNAKKIELLRKTALLRTVRMLRKVPETNRL